MKASSAFLLAAFSAAATAVPAHFHQGHVVQVRSTSTSYTPTTCVSGVPPSTATWPMEYAAVATNGLYDIESSFDTAHSIGSTMNLYMNHTSTTNEFASYKCQFACNSMSGCVSFFGRFVEVNSSTEHFECLGFSAL
ncbi:hypothetical protein Daus18300_000912 [Diaporthe australafricana]|uniref:Uncharacterized protein n=1 Tax=Diaporthe australafricana TaxID=127596 RepID=A0ABR3Y0U6_9PEZI